MVKERKIEAQPIHSDEKLVTTQTFERRAQFALSISTVLAVATIFMVISMVILWLFFRSYTQLLITSGVLLVMLVGSVAYHMLHRNGYTELGLYVLLISILIPVFAVGILMPDLLLAVSVGFLTQIALAILFLGDRQSHWFIAGGVVCLVADVVLANTVAADWFNPLEKKAAMVVAVAMGGIVLLVGNMVIRMMVLGQETQFRQAQLSSLEVERKAATEREQRVLMEQANQEIEKRAAAEQEQRRNLFNVLTQVNEAATDLNSASAEILAATTQQAAGASEQSAAISQTTTTVEEVKTISEQASMRSQEVATAAQRTVEVARMGQSSVQDTIGSMGEIKERVESIAENILSLSEQTQQIGEIISTVNEIASQPNMLALNASVEAARAGEHGKGFAVVAMEVRSLADQSKQATVQSLASTRQAEKSAQSLNELARKMADTVAQYKL